MTEKLRNGMKATVQSRTTQNVAGGTVVGAPTAMAVAAWLVSWVRSLELSWLWPAENDMVVAGVVAALIATVVIPVLSRVAALARNPEKLRQASRGAVVLLCAGLALGSVGCATTMTNEVQQSYTTAAGETYTDRVVQKSKAGAFGEAQPLQNIAWDFEESLQITQEGDLSNAGQVQAAQVISETASRTAAQVASELIGGGVFDRGEGPGAGGRMDGLLQQLESYEALVERLCPWVCRLPSAPVELRSVCGCGE